MGEGCIGSVPEIDVGTLVVLLLEFFPFAHLPQCLKNKFLISLVRISVLLNAGTRKKMNVQKK